MFITISTQISLGMKTILAKYIYTEGHSNNTGTIPIVKMPSNLSEEKIKIVKNYMQKVFSTFSYSIQGV